MYIDGTSTLKGLGTHAQNLEFLWSFAQVKVDLINATVPYSLLTMWQSLTSVAQLWDRVREETHIR